MSNKDSKKRVKDEAEEKFAKSNYKDLFSILYESLSIEEFYNFCSKKRWLSRESGRFFFINFLVDQNRLKQFFESPISDRLLKDYFKLTGFNKLYEFKNLEVFLIENFTETYVKAVRKNKQFLNDERIKFWNEKNFESFSQHLIIWNAIYLKEKKYWDKCESLLKKVKCFSPSTFISALSIALNKKDKLYNKIPLYFLPRLSRSVDVILEHYLINNTNLQKDIVEGDKVTREEIDLILKVLDCILVWGWYNQKVIDVYVRTEEINLKEEEKFLHSPEENYEYMLGQKRLNMTKEFYKQKTKINQLSDNDTFIYCVATDIFISDLKYNLNESWKDCLMILANKLSALKITHKEIFINKLKEETLIKLFNKETFSLLVYENIKKYFNRKFLNLKTEVYPFIKFGNQYLYFSIFHNSSDVFYTMSDLIFEHEDEDEKVKDLASKNMENELVEICRQKGWVKSISDAELSGKPSDKHLPKGDIDLYIQDETAQILVQFKRNRISLQTEVIQYEKDYKDEDAAKQLLKAENYLKENPVFCIEKDGYKYAQLQTNYKKWVVSTSHEWIGNLNDGVRKVNYFELIHIIQSSFYEINTVNDLIYHIENETLLKRHLKEDPVLLIDPNEHIVNPNFLENNKIKEADTAFENDEYEKAIEILDAVLKNEPENISAICTMAKVYYKDLKYISYLIKKDDLNADQIKVLYEKAEEYIDKALKYIPTDPCLKRWKGHLLTKKGEILKGLKLLKENAQKFWYVSFKILDKPLIYRDLMEDYDLKRDQLFHQKKLSDDDLTHLNSI